MQVKLNLTIIFRILLLTIYLIQDGSFENEQESDCKSSEKDCGCSKLKREHQDPSKGFKYTKAANIDNESGDIKEDISFKRTNQMVYLKGGVFTMGTDKPFIERDGEGPARKVQLRPFHIDVYEVSNAEFELFVDETKYVTEVKIIDSFY